MPLDQKKITLKPRSEISREKWDAFVDKSSGAWLLHTFDMQDSIATWPGKSDLSFAVMDYETGEILAVVPLHKIARPFLGKFPNFHLESMGGFALLDELNGNQKKLVIETCNNGLLQLVTEFKAEETRIYLAPGTPSLLSDDAPHHNPLVDLGFEDTSGQTWMLDLQAGKDAIWNNMEKRARNAIRKAVKLGVTVQRVDDPQSVDMYYDLHCQTYARTGASALPKAYFESIWQKILPVSHAVVFSASLDNKVVAMENFGVYKNSAVYWSGAASADGLTCQANSLIQWTAIQWMVDNGIQWYETGEAFPLEKEGKRKGLNDFKKSFGGQLVPIFRGRRKGTSGKAGLYRFLRSIRH